MMQITHFSPHDLAEIVPQASQALPEDIDAKKLGTDFVARGPGWTLWDCENRGRWPQSGRILAVGGFVNHSPLHASLWAVLAENKRTGLNYLTKFMQRQIATRLGALEVARIDMTVDPLDLSAVRWAVILGFRFEAVKRCYGADGRDMHEYVIIRSPLS
jgi:hypothetical protein